MFYQGIDTSAAGCTACACSPPQGGVCQAITSAYGDAACSAEFASNTAGLDSPQCNDTMPGLELQSMSATWMTNQPGTCTPSGGEPFGEATPAKPATFCCQVKPL